MDQTLGEIRIWADGYVESYGWLSCDGQELPIPQYPELFSLIGNIFGGNGITTFRLPNLNANGLAMYGPDDSNKLPRYYIVAEGFYPQIPDTDSTPNTLENLLLKDSANNNITFTTTFDSMIVRYSATVKYNIESVIITPTATDSNAKITINDMAVESGQDSAPVSLVTGNNTITIVVTPVVGAAINYIITVTKQPGTDANLSDLLLSDGTNDVFLTPDFSKNTTYYTANVGYNVKSVSVKPIPQDSSALVTVNGQAKINSETDVNLNVGVNTINVAVILVDGTTKTYQIDITRDSSAYLSGLTIITNNTNAAYSPTFNRSVTQYTTAPLGGASVITIVPTCEDSNAMVNVGGVVVLSGQPATLFAPQGSGVIQIIVTPNIGDTRMEYNLNIIN